VSNESGATQVYVQSIPATGAKWQISTTGGSQPTWRRDGKELFYVDPNHKLMGVPVKGGGTFEAGAPQPLFDGIATYIPGQAPPTLYYQPSADGQRFMVTVPSGGETAAPPVSIVVNWLAAVKK